MLLKRAVLDRIVTGEVSLVFRRWKRPTVKTGGTLRTAVGVLDIISVEPVDPDAISTRDALRAGFSDTKTLLDELCAREEGSVYCVQVQFCGDDPRKALRAQSKLSDAEYADVKTRLEKMDARSRDAAWTRQSLELIEANPGTRAGDLAAAVGMETRAFKSRVRRLKELGLTESLEVGYRLSPRGQTFLNRLRKEV